MRPLFARFRTRVGNCYVYDAGTGEILTVSDAVYEIVDDYHVLTPDEMYEKHRALGREAVRAALAQLDEAQEEGLLRDHAPAISARVESLQSAGKLEPIRDFLGHRRRLLTLELTHECNLACEYCVFGKHYPERRQHSSEPMSLDTAKRVVSRFLSHKPRQTTIGFYGGEPLLELERMKEIVAFAEPLAVENGVELRFNVTTNGTLLSEETIHYLVAHKFAVMISLDGNRESHDRYRVFKSTGHSEQPRGSFDVVIRNMDRFAQLYPDYNSRGIALTWTATADLSEIEKFLERWQPLYPAFVATYVNGVEHRGEESEAGRIGAGECPASCGDESCLRRNSQREGASEVPEFLDLSSERKAALDEGYETLVSKLVQCSDPNTARELCERESPIFADLLAAEIERVHRRSVARRKPAPIRLSCFPGATRTYISLRGEVFPCERVEFGKLHEIGDAAGDVDGGKACDSLVERVRLGCDCGNCIGAPVCPVCPAHVAESKERPGNPDYLALQSICEAIASNSIGTRLPAYAELMEANSRVADWIYPPREGDPKEWMSHVKAVVEKQEHVDLLVEELAELA